MDETNNSSPEIEKAEEQNNTENIPENISEEIQTEQTDVSPAPAAEESAPAEEAAEKPAEEPAVQAGRKFDAGTFLIRLVVIAFFFVALGMLSKIIYGYAKDRETQRKIEKEADIHVTDTEETLRPERAVPPYPGVMVPSLTYPKIVNLEKLQKLKELNSDFALWFYLDGTDISYPVMYSGDNSYYLKKDFYGNSNVGGTLFLDFRNVEIGGNTIIYGHNMKNGTMFGELKNYNNEVFFKQHRMVYTYSEDQIIAWEVFSVYPTNIKNNYIKTSFSTEEDYVKFLQKVQNDSLFKTDIVLDASCDILTLSTCRNGEGNDGRFVVHAVKIQSFPMS